MLQVSITCNRTFLELFIKFCKELNINEQNSIQKELIKIFDQLLISSGHVLFSQTYSRSRTLDRNFVGFTNCYGEHKSIFEENCKNFNENIEKDSKKNQFKKMW